MACLLAALCIAAALPACAETGYGFLITRQYNGQTYYDADYTEVDPN